MRTVLITTATIALFAASAAAAPKRPPPPPVLTPFSATAAFGETIEILSHGPMTLLLHCFRDAIGDVAALAVVSTEDDMLITGEPGVLQPVGRGVTLHFGSVPPPDGGGYVGADDTPTHFSDFRGSGSSAITPSGWVLAVPADGVGYGIATYRFSVTPRLAVGAGLLCDRTCPPRASRRAAVSSLFPEIWPGPLPGLFHSFSRSSNGSVVGGGRTLTLERELGVIPNSVASTINCFSACRSIATNADCTW